MKKLFLLIGVLLTLLVAAILLLIYGTVQWQQDLAVVLLTPIGLVAWELIFAFSISKFNKMHLYSISRITTLIAQSSAFISTVVMISTKSYIAFQITVSIIVINFILGIGTVIFDIVKHRKTQQNKQ